MAEGGNNTEADVYFKTELVLEKGDKLFLSGNIPELGCWKEEYAIEATPVEPYSEGLHLVIIKLPMHRPIRWKWAIANEDSKIQKWENCGNRQLFIKHKIVLIYAPWNKETKIMDESVRAYEFVPSFVLFDIAWQKNIPPRHKYKPDPKQQQQQNTSEPDLTRSKTHEKKSSRKRENNDTLTTDMVAVKETLSELQKTWSRTDHSESLEDFMKKGYEEFKKSKDKRPPSRSSSPKKVTFKDHPSVVCATGGDPYDTSRPDSSSLKCKYICEDKTKRSEQPSCSNTHEKQEITPQGPSQPPMDAHTRVIAYLDHIEGEKKRRESLTDEEKALEDQEVEKDGNIAELCPVPKRDNSQRNLVLITSTLGSAILVFLGYYTYKKWNS